MTPIARSAKTPMPQAKQRKALATMDRDEEFTHCSCKNYRQRVGPYP
jgi:hypothetical protein